MKDFNLTEFNKNGTEFFSINIKFNQKDGISITEEKYIVSVRNSRMPNQKCDFIANGFSCNSKNFFEVSGFSNPNTLFFTHNSEFRLNQLFYVLPENKDAVINELKLLFNDFISNELDKATTALQEAKNSFLNS